MTRLNYSESFSIRYLLRTWIKIYQKSFLKIFPPSCRFYPCCSEYAVLCLEHQNFSQAIRKIFHRILRCHPWSAGGVDLP